MILSTRGCYQQRVSRVRLSQQIVFLLFVGWLCLASPISLAASSASSSRKTSLYVRGEEVIFVNGTTYASSSNVGKAGVPHSPFSSSCGSSMMHFPVHVGLSLAPVSSSSKRKQHVRRRTSVGLENENVVEERDVSNTHKNPQHHKQHPVVRKLAAIPSSSGTQSTDSASLFVGLVTSRDFLLSSTIGSNLQLFTEVTFSTGQYQETACMSFGKRYLFYNPMSTIQPQEGEHSMTQQRWNLLVCHRYILTEGDFIVIEIVSNKRPNGVHCQRVNPVDAIRMTSSSSSGTLDIEVKDYLQQLHASYRSIHPVVHTPKALELSLIQPTSTPTSKPTLCTDSPTSRPTSIPTLYISPIPTLHPTAAPSMTSAPSASNSSNVSSTSTPTVALTHAPTAVPTAAPTISPSAATTIATSAASTAAPTVVPSVAPTAAPTFAPNSLPGSGNSTVAPTIVPTTAPTVAPSAAPTVPSTTAPSASPNSPPTVASTSPPTAVPTDAPSAVPTVAPSLSISTPTDAPTASPTYVPTLATTDAPTTPGTTDAPTLTPTAVPSIAPSTLAPTVTPTIAGTITPTLDATAVPTLNMTGKCYFASTLN